MTNQELHDYAADHLYYELLMLYETASRLVRDPAVESDWVLKNALIEAFTIHVRSLAVFLYPEEAVTRRDDVTADNYVADPEKWRADKPPLPGELKKAISRTGKEIAHLTTKRLPPGDPAKGWSPEPLLLAFIEPLRKFVTNVPPSRLDISVTRFIAELPVAPAASPPASSVDPPAAAATDSAGVLGMSVPTGRLQGRTDISTP